MPLLKALAALTLLAPLLAGVCLGLSAPAPSPRAHLAAAPLAAAPSPLAAPEAPPPAAGAPAPREAAPARDRGAPRGSVRVGTPRGVLYVPAALAGTAASYDLVIHFHGATAQVEAALEGAGVRAVLYTVNLGNGSGKYEAAFQDQGSFDRMLAEVEQIVQKRVPGFGAARPARVALSAWSAGYGAVARVLSLPAAGERLDAVLLADGMHASFLPGTRRIDPLGMAPYLRFARRAARGERLMAITHSQIDPSSYASTSLTADAVIRALDLRRSPPGPAPGKMVMYERAEGGDLHVLGFRGNDAPAHCDHLYGLGPNLYSLLAARWGS